MADDTDFDDETIDRALERYKRLLWEGADRGLDTSEAISDALDRLEDDEAFQQLLDDDPEDRIGAVEAEFAGDAASDDDTAADEWLDED